MFHLSFSSKTKIFIVMLCFLGCKKNDTHSSTLNSSSSTQAIRNIYGFSPVKGPKTKVSGFSCDETGVLVANRLDGTKERLLHSPKSIGWDPTFPNVGTLCETLPKQDFSQVTAEQPLSIQVSFLGRRPVVCLAAGIEHFITKCKEEAGISPYSSIWVRLPRERDGWLTPSEIRFLAESPQLPSATSQPSFQATALAFLNAKTPICQSKTDEDETCIFAEKLFRVMLHSDQQDPQNPGEPNRLKARILYLGEGYEGSFTHLRLFFDPWEFEPSPRK
jgi:hypothetical protein